MVRTDSAGASHWFAEECRDPNIGFSLGYWIDGRVRDALLLVQEQDWAPAREAGLQLAVGVGRAGRERAACSRAAAAAARAPWRRARTPRSAISLADPLVGPDDRLGQVSQRLIVPADRHGRVRRCLVRSSTPRAGEVLMNGGAQQRVPPGRAPVGQRHEAALLGRGEVVNAAAGGAQRRRDQTRSSHRRLGDHGSRFPGVFVRRHWATSGYQDEIIHDDDYVLWMLTKLIDDSSGAQLGGAGRRHAEGTPRRRRPVHIVHGDVARASGLAKPARLSAQPSVLSELCPLRSARLPASPTRMAESPVVDGRVSRRARLIRVVVLTLIVGGLVVGALSVGGTYVEAVGVEIGSAALLFGAFQWLAPSWRPDGRITAIALGVGVALLVVAWVQSSAFWQALLLELGAGVALLIALDGYVGHLLDQARAIEIAKAEQDERERQQAARRLHNELTVRLRRLTGDDTAELSLGALMQMEIWDWITDQDLYESHDSGRYPFPSLPAAEDPDWVETWASTVNRSAAFKPHERRATDSSTNEVPFNAMVEDEEPPKALG